MSDLISRTAAIDAFSKRGDEKIILRSTVYEVLKKLPSAQPEYYDYSDIDLVWKYYAEEHDVNLTDGAKQLKDAMWVGYRKGKQNTQPEWIPCSERLPEEDGEYFVTVEGYLEGEHVLVLNYGTPLLPMNVGEGRAWYLSDIEGDYYYDGVIAWMPLPEPYKERGGEE